jgi:hypothetical protein
MKIAEEIQATIEIIIYTQAHTGGGSGPFGQGKIYTFI